MKDRYEVLEAEDGKEEIFFLDTNPSSSSSAIVVSYSGDEKKDDEEADNRAQNSMWDIQPSYDEEIKVFSATWESDVAEPLETHFRTLRG